MKRPLIFAHRGASAYAPENTRAAFLMARDMGADGFECDIHLCKDGIPVVVHDGYLLRVTRKHIWVFDQRLRDLKALDVGVYFSRKFKGERMLTLEETLALTGPKFVCMAELKEHRSEKENERLAAKCAPLLKGAYARACSFSETICRIIRDIAPKIPVDYTFNARLKSNWDKALKTAKLNGVQGLSMNFRHWSESRAKQARALGLRMDAWTVNRKRSLSRLAALGVDSIETDKPDVALQLLNGR